MRSDRQPVATHGKGFALISPVSPPGDFERRCRCVRVAGEAESDARVEGTLQIISIRALRLALSVRTGERRSNPWIYTSRIEIRL
jgi:hypothetical protein